MGIYPLLFLIRRSAPFISSLLAILVFPYNVASRRGVWPSPSLALIFMFSKVSKYATAY
jgi:hypothetical protein